jgi:hypothetical protein
MWLYVPCTTAETGRSISSLPVLSAQQAITIESETRLHHASLPFDYTLCERADTASSRAHKFSSPDVPRQSPWRAESETATLALGTNG